MVTEGEHISSTNLLAVRARATIRDRTICLAICGEIAKVVRVFGVKVVIKDDLLDIPDDIAEALSSSIPRETAYRKREVGKFPYFPAKGAIDDRWRCSLMAPYIEVKATDRIICAPGIELTRPPARRGVFPLSLRGQLYRCRDPV